MESDIIVEGLNYFKSSMASDILNLLGMEDSSLLAHLREDITVWGHDIEKQECANHAVKCY